MHRLVPGHSPCCPERQIPSPVLAATLSLALGAAFVCASAPALACAPCVNLHLAYGPTYGIIAALRGTANV